MMRFTIPHTGLKWRGFFILTRPINVVISFISIFVAALVCGGIQPWQHVLFACLAGAFITAGANAINDYFDIDIDKINKPYRPLPSGWVTPSQTKVFALTMFLIGLFFGLLINRYAFLVTIIFSVLLYFYSAVFKRKMILGNFVVSLSTGFAFIFGGIAIGKIENAIFPAIFSFLMHFGREIIKDIEDVHGDSMHQADTLPVLHGVKPAQVLVSVIFILLMGITIVPYILNIYSIVFLLIVLAGVHTVLIYAMVMTWKNPDRETMHKISTLLKIDMFIGLAAILAG